MQLVFQLWSWADDGGGTVLLKKQRDGRQRQEGMVSERSPSFSISRYSTPDVCFQPVPPGGGLRCLVVQVTIPAFRVAWSGPVYLHISRLSRRRCANELLTPPDLLRDPVLDQSPCLPETSKGLEVMLNLTGHVFNLVF